MNERSDTSLGAKLVVLSRTPVADILFFVHNMLKTSFSVKRRAERRLSDKEYRKGTQSTLSNLDISRSRAQSCDSHRRVHGHSNTRRRFKAWGIDPDDLFYASGSLEREDVREQMSKSGVL